MKTAPLLVAFYLFLASLHVHAQTAEEMASNCRKVADATVSNGEIDVPADFQSGICWGAFTSFQKATHIVGYDNKPILGICYTAHVTTSQDVKVFLAYVDRHPEKLNQDYFWVAMAAAREAFPCKSLP
jgi:hypothetical protein